MTATAATSDREISLSRVFDAPRELIWKAWTDPVGISNWWGPEGFTTTTKSMDLRPGGVWDHTMHGPDGTDYPNHTEYIEVSEPERLVYTNEGANEGGTHVKFISTVTFDDLGNGMTRLTVNSVFPSAELRDKIDAEYGASEGLKDMFTRLARYLS